MIASATACRYATVALSRRCQTVTPRSVVMLTRPRCRSVLRRTRMILRRQMRALRKDMVTKIMSAMRDARARCCCVLEEGEQTRYKDTSGLMIERRAMFKTYTRVVMVWMRRVICNVQITALRARWRCNEARYVIHVARIIGTRLRGKHSCVRC